VLTPSTFRQAIRGAYLFRYVTILFIRVLVYNGFKRC
jgi:hypothetical protein